MNTETQTGRLHALFDSGRDRLLNIYFTAGYPRRDDTVTIIRELAAAGADLVEIGMPYSDPLADGPTIQASSQQALANGMHLDLMFAQVKEARSQVGIPLILMGYFNQALQYGLERFCQACQEAGVDGLIIPDLPVEIYEAQYRAVFEAHSLPLIFLISPHTPEARIRKIDDLSSSFIYMVSRSSITGAKSGIEAAQLDYFQRINQMELKNPRLIGFGISSRETFDTACQHARGAIIGSAFIKALSQSGDLRKTIHSFINLIKPQS